MKDLDVLGLSAKRLNRSSYFLSLFGSMFLFVGVGLLLDAFLRIAFNILEGQEAGIFTVISMVAWYIYAPYCAIRRLHDLDMSGWFLLVAFVPLANIYLGLKLLFSKGDINKNRYGEPLNRSYIMGLGL